MSKAALHKPMKRVHGVEVVGRTKDGVHILKSPRATHFSTDELRAAVAAAREKNGRAERIKRAG
jgi:hypothetical protein